MEKSNQPIWVPQPGPQTSAYFSDADILFYGGAAGGGKTDLLIGLSLSEHKDSIIFRREGTQHKGIVRRITEIVGSKDCYNGQDKAWALPGRTVDLGSCAFVGDEEKHQGIPHDLTGFDEITHFTEDQFRFLIGWNRSVHPNQRCRIVCTGNPPTDSDGEWVIRFWAPWLDQDHPDPAAPGELRWFATVDGKDKECEGPEPFEHNGETITPLSRTFIPSQVTDNYYLKKTAYTATLQGLPEPLRSQMLHGDFTAGLGGDPFQVIPSAWVEQSMARWDAEGKQGKKMDSIGADIARGGRDHTTIARRYGLWFDEAISYPGPETPSGPLAASLILAVIKDKAPVHVDVIGVGSSAYDHLAENNIQAVAVNNSEGSKETDKSGQLSFKNRRAELMWKMREALDPEKGDQIILPPDSELKADLCCARWKLTVQGIQIEGKEELKKRIGRSPDKGDAYVMALIATPKRQLHIAPRQRPRKRSAAGWMGN